MEEEETSRRRGGGWADDEIGWSLVTRRQGRDYRGRRYVNPLGWRLGSTFFIRNFPENCKVEDLRRKFEEIGDVEDVFIPNKRDKLGLRFGFVRISNGGSEREILERLNKVWFGSHIIRASIPKHARPQKPARFKPNSCVWPQLGERDKESRKPELPKLCFVDALKREAPRAERNLQRPAGPTSVAFSSSEEDLGWLSDAFSGRLKRGFSWADHGEELKSECMGSLKVVDMGADLVLITSSSETPTQETIADFNDWSSFWFEWTRPWKQSDVNGSREVWVKLQGTPLHAWTSTFFESICSKVGLVEEIHKSTLRRERLDVAWVKVKTGLCSIDRMVECCIDGEMFSIRVEERPDLDVWEMKYEGEASSADDYDDFMLSDDESSAEGSLRDGAGRPEPASFSEEPTVEGEGRNLAAPPSGTDIEENTRVRAAMITALQTPGDKAADNAYQGHSSDLVESQGMTTAGVISRETFFDKGRLDKETPRDGLDSDSWAQPPFSGPGSLSTHVDFTTTHDDLSPLPKPADPKHTDSLLPTDSLEPTTEPPRKGRRRKNPIKAKINWKKLARERK